MNTHIASTPQVKRLERTKSPRIFAGVAGGLGRYFDLNPAVFRLGLVVLTLLGGAGILVYLAAVLVIPQEGAEQSIAEKVLAERRDRPWPLVGLGMVAVAVAVLLSRADVWPAAGAPAWRPGPAVGPAAGAGGVFALVAGPPTLGAGRGGKPHRVLIALLVTIGVLLAAAATAVVVAFAWFDVSLDDGVGNRDY